MRRSIPVLVCMILIPIFILIAIVGPWYSAGFQDGPYPYGYKEYRCWNETLILMKQ